MLGGVSEFVGLVGVDSHRFRLFARHSLRFLNEWPGGVGDLQLWLV